ncbi:MAG: methyl-accepting chemotaxis protein [Pseudomonadales bacterium]|nr:methyl-accepting chemotaxis protein [Pseudomonadales bacterium]
MNKLSMRGKFTLLIATISLIFIVSLFVIRNAGDEIADSFNRFYQENFTAQQKFERVKDAQVGIMVSSRGLQIVYLLKFEDQVPGFIAELDENHRITPDLLNDLEKSYAGPKSTFDELKRLTQDYQSKNKAFVQAMQSSADHAAPYAIFKAFVDSYEKLMAFFERFSQEVDEAALESQQVTQSNIQTATLTFYVALVLAVTAALLLGGGISGQIIRGINQVREDAEKLSKGDLSGVAEPEGSDEIADLRRSIAGITDHLGKVVREIMESADVVHDNSSAVLQENNRLHDVAGRVSDNLMQVVTAIEEMSSTAKVIAENTNSTAAASTDIARQAQEGLQSSAQAMQAIAEVVSSLGETSEVITRLREETTNIEKILDVIRGISEQTNLLALNAAIEAARAGEQGRGFAVVADEVRGLAQRSQESVNEIETLLSQLSQASVSAVERMTSSTGTADVARQKVEENNAMIESVITNIDQVNDQSQQIATAAEEQSAVVEDISRNVHEVQGLTDDCTTIAESTNRSSQNMNAASEKVSELLKFFSVR